MVRDHVLHELRVGSRVRCVGNRDCLFRTQLLHGLAWRTRLNDGRIRHADGWLSRKKDKQRNTP
jgi:hypothetical protein